MPGFPRSIFVKKPRKGFDPNLGFGGQGHFNSKREAYSYLWVGRIIHVDTETMVCSIRFESGQSERHDVPIPASGGSGPRSWSGTFPEPGTLVLVGWKKYSNRDFTPYIISMIGTGIFPGREYEPWMSADPADVDAILNDFPELEDDTSTFWRPIRLKSRKGYSGNFLATSSDGSDFLLDRDTFLTNRSGNEFRLRDADQTAILQVLNEFTQNAAGYYRRGLIKRNLFNLLPDLPFDPTTGALDPTSLAFAKLVELGIINPTTGMQIAPQDPNNPFYPYVVTSDGQRISYVTQGDHTQSFALTDECYVEDRREIKNTSNGYMDVTEEGDGFQIDNLVWMIEDVHGTVVGNDAFNDPALYKQILKMSLFDSIDQRYQIGIVPKFSAVDTVTDISSADKQALARLFRIKSPRAPFKQYVFGVTKEGRVYLNIPASGGGPYVNPEEKDRSVDINTEGLIKAVLGMNALDQKSLDLSCAGGVRADFGVLKGSGNSIELVMKGALDITYTNNDPSGIARKTKVGGSDYYAASAARFSSVGANDTKIVGGQDSLECTARDENIGQGGRKAKTAGDDSLTVLGKSNYNFAQMRETTCSIGDKKTITLGVDTLAVTAGGIDHSIDAGNWSETVNVGNRTSTVETGNYSISVSAGNFSASVSAGAISLIAGGGAASLSASLAMTLTSSVELSLSAPITRTGLSNVGGIVAGSPGPGTIALDYITGTPLLGMPNHFIGP